VLANIMAESLLLPEMWQQFRMQILYGGFEQIIFIYTHCWGLMKSVVSNGSWLLSSMMEVMV
jgi:hypothetical protein